MSEIKMNGYIWVTKLVMKVQLILLFLLACVVGTEAFATDTDPKQEEKKTQKSKYDFNIFKLYSITVDQVPDSLKVDIKALPPKRKKK
ncbi:MAG: hypothetical protein COA97_08080 [Flavobacteriales bacterium]|nr:MAG: hypothetical protein COA97_08080 [Flavobacteriales bacterium]